MDNNRQKQSKKKLNQLEKNIMWTLVAKHSIEPSHKSLSKKQIFKLKKNVNGIVSRFKAKQIVWRQLQEFSIDFDQTFAAIIKPMTFRVLLDITAYYDFDINQLNMKTTFFYRLID